MSTDEIKVYRVSELSNKAVKGRKEAFTKGYSCGFQSGEELMSYKPGFSTGIYSYSAQGKTQFYIEQSVFLSKEYGLKHAIWLTESGKKEEMILDIAMTYLGKSFFSKTSSVTDDDVLKALAWMDSHFFIIDHEAKMLNIRDIYQSVINIEKKYNVKIDCVAIDNATNLSREADKARMMIHEYMNYLLTSINRVSSKRNYHTFILYHVNNPTPIEDKDTKKRYYPLPTHYEISGGAQINFLSYQLICVWRPISREDQLGIIDPNTGQPYELNESQIVISKSKPKFTGNQGAYKLFFDTDRQSYYERINGKKYYAGDYQREQEAKSPLQGSAMKPSTAFNDSASIREVDDIF